MAKEAVEEHQALSAGFSLGLVSEGPSVGFLVLQLAGIGIDFIQIAKAAKLWNRTRKVLEYGSAADFDDLEAEYLAVEALDAATKQKLGRRLDDLRDAWKQVVDELAGGDLPANAQRMAIARGAPSPKSLKNPSERLASTGQLTAARLRAALKRRKLLSRLSAAERQELDAIVEDANAAAKRSKSTIFPQVAKARAAQAVSLDGLGLSRVGKTHVIDVGNYRLLDLPDGSDVLYVLENKKTGEILKVGKTGDLALLERFPHYERAGAKLGLDLELEVTPVTPPKGTKVQQAEEALRLRLTNQGHALPWDNTGGRLGREGPGTPFAPLSSRPGPGGTPSMRKRLSARTSGPSSKPQMAI